MIMHTADSRAERYVLLRLMSKGALSQSNGPDNYRQSIGTRMGIPLITLSTLRIDR